MGINEATSRENAIRGILFNMRISFQAILGLFNVCYGLNIFNNIFN